VFTRLSSGRVRAFVLPFEACACSAEKKVCNEISAPERFELGNCALTFDC